MFLLCAYGDRDRWVSVLEPLLYPTGVTFYRLFSYRRQYFYPEQIADQLSDQSQCQPLLQNKNWNDGFFGLRFRDESAPEFLPVFIPLRKVSLVGVEGPDHLNLRFRIGQYVVPEYSQDQGRKVFPRLDLAGMLGNLTETRLFLQLREAEKSVASKWTVSHDFPSDFFEVFEKSLSAPVMSKMRNTVMLRLVALKDRGELPALAPEEIDSKKHIWGYRLREDKTYDLTVSYARIIEPGFEVPPVENLFSLTNPPEELQASRRQIHIVGNYRSEDLWLSPKCASPGPVLVAYEPAKLGQPGSAVDQTASKTVGLKIPALIEPQRWSRERKINAALSFGGFVASWLAFKWYKVSPEAVQKVILLLMTAFVSLFVVSLKDVFLPKK